MHKAISSGLTRDTRCNPNPFASLVVFVANPAHPGRALDSGAQCLHAQTCACLSSRCAPLLRGWKEGLVCSWLRCREGRLYLLLLLGCEGLSPLACPVMLFATLLQLTVGHFGGLEARAPPACWISSVLCCNCPSSHVPASIRKCPYPCDVDLGR